MGMIGFCTAPRRERAPTSTIDSIHVGSCHDTLVPSPTPGPAGGGPQARVAVRAERDRPPALVGEDQRRVGRLRRARLDQRPHPAFVDHLVTTGLTGEPSPPVNGWGEASNRNV